MENSLDPLCSELRELALLKSVSSVLGWDEQVNLPPKGTDHRADQLALLAGLTHARATSSELGDLISAAEGQGFDAESQEAAVVRVARRHYDRTTRLPQSLVEEISRTSTLAQQAWVTARQESEFETFRPWLEKIIALKREEADAAGGPDLGPGKKFATRYDVLLDDYEPGMTTAQVDAIFGPLAESMSALVADIAAADPIDTSLLERDYPVDAQRQLSEFVAAAVGFDMDAGRIDEAAHPFCSGFGPGDCRLTTRYDPHLFTQALYGTLHETGHGLYELGLPADTYGTGLYDAASLGVHESQSRLWENFVGRSPEFWTFIHPHVKELFPKASNLASAADYHRASNAVRPSFIRVEADEVTYNLHIVLRYELEQEMMDGSLDAADVPARWNERFKELLGLDVPDAAQGCLQDVHWSAGLLGYFPTYALGNLYAAQLMVAARRDLPGLDSQITNGQFAPLLTWLRERVHAHGHRYAPPELIERACGQPLSAEPLNAYLREKFGALYDLP